MSGNSFWYDNTIGLAGRLFDSAAAFAVGADAPSDENLPPWASAEQRYWNGNRTNYAPYVMAPSEQVLQVLNGVRTNTLDSPMPVDKPETPAIMTIPTEALIGVGGLLGGNLLPPGVGMGVKVAGSIALGHASYRFIKAGEEIQKSLTPTWLKKMLGQ